jgi:hypothetical protein
MLLSTALGFKSVGDTLTVDFNGIIIFAVLIAIAVTAKFAFKKKISPILMILISAGLGMIMYSL